MGWTDRLMWLEEEDVWELNAPRAGVSAVSISHISPYQWSRMSGAQKRRVERERHAHSEKAAATHKGWEEAVIKAWEQKKFKLFGPGVSKDANSVIFSHMRWRKALSYARAERAVARENTVTPETVKKGDILHHLSMGKVTVDRPFKKSIRLIRRDGSKYNEKSLGWLNRYSPRETEKRINDLVSDELGSDYARVSIDDHDLRKARDAVRRRR